MTEPCSSDRRSGMPQSIQWVRKRSGEIARFDPERLARSFSYAAADIGERVPSELAGELARMVTYFISANSPRQIPGSEEVADWAEKALRETGHQRLAESYRSFVQSKLQARSSLRVDGSQTNFAAEPMPTSCWDKTRLVESLRIRLNLELATARHVAGQVERVILASQLRRLSDGLIRELANNVLAEGGLGLRLVPSDQVQVATADLMRELRRCRTADAANRAVTRSVWRQFSLSEVVSPDVAEAQEHGLLRIAGLESPANLAASCIQCTELVRSSESAEASIARFGERLSLGATESSGAIALDLVEPWLALIAEPGDSPAKLAERFWQELCSRLQHAGPACVLNSYGGFPQRMKLDVGAGPLFGWQPEPGQRSFAAATAEELLGRFARDAAEWPALRFGWHWHGAGQPISEPMTRWVVRLAQEGQRISVCFDRTRIALAEGLYRERDSIRPVLEYVGINLPVLWREAGSPATISSLENELIGAVRLAVRAAIQRREFLRALPLSIHPSRIDQATLVVVPIGLDWLVHQVLGLSFAEDPSGLRLAESLVRLLEATLRREARHFALGTLVDGALEDRVDPWPTGAGRRKETQFFPKNRVSGGLEMPDASAQGRSGEQESAELLEGLTPLPGRSGPRQQIHAAGQLHAIARAGTVLCTHCSDRLEHEELRGLLDWAGSHSQLMRFRLAPARSSSSQSTVDWPDS